MLIVHPVMKNVLVCLLLLSAASATAQEIQPLDGWGLVHTTDFGDVIDKPTVELALRTIRGNHWLTWWAILIPMDRKYGDLP